MASLNSFAGASEENARSAGVIDAELRLESGTWRLVARELEHARMNLEVDSIDVLSLERMGGSELCAAVDARVNDDPAGERLVRVERDLEARSDGCDATNPAGMRITGGASVSAATIVLCSCAIRVSGCGVPPRSIGDQAIIAQLACSWPRGRLLVKR